VAESVPEVSVDVGTVDGTGRTSVDTAVAGCQPPVRDTVHPRGPKNESESGSRSDRGRAGVS
jgi:hypothetical protein